MHFLLRRDTEYLYALMTMINASGGAMPSMPNTSSPTPSGVPSMPQAGAGTPAAAPTQPPILPSQPMPSTTPPASGNAPIGGSSKTGSSLQKPKKKLPWKMIAGVIILILTIIGATAGYLLTQTSQDVRQQASGGDDIYTEIDTNIGYCCVNNITTAGLTPSECNGAGGKPGRCAPTSGNCCVSGQSVDATPGECTSLGGSVGQCTNDECSVGATKCVSNAKYVCKAASSGNFYSPIVPAETCEANCTSETDCAGELTCNLTSGKCEEPQAGGACTSESDCPGLSLVCNTTLGKCVNSTGLLGDCNQSTLGNLKCTSSGEQQRCAQSGSQYSFVSTGVSCGATGTNTSTSNSNNETNSGVNGTGSCAQCLGLGGQAERDCYANCSGTIQTGICAGLTASECQATCSSSGGQTQVCTGTQEVAGSERAGEFLSCGASSTNGCGQVDCLDASGDLIGFVIDNSSCTATGGTTLITDSSTENNSSSNNSNSNNNNESSPNPSPSVSPSPSPTLSPELASCNEACKTSADCADLLHSCQNDVCRLTDNPTSTTCTETTGATPTPVPRTEDTPLQCNDPCTSNDDCSSFNHICHNERCRLSTNLDNVSCKETVEEQSSTTELGQINQQPDVPTVLPSAGANDLKNWLLTGLGAIGVGAVILLLL